MKKAIIRKHSLVLLAGFLHALKSTLAVAFLAAVVVLLCSVQIESGYLAVGKFIAALLAFCVSVLLFYNCGRDIAGGKFSK